MKKLLLILLCVPYFCFGQVKIQIDGEVEVKNKTQDKIEITGEVIIKETPEITTWDLERIAEDHRIEEEAWQHMQKFNQEINEKIRQEELEKIKRSNLTMKNPRDVIGPSIFEKYKPGLIFIFCVLIFSFILKLIFKRKKNESKDESDNSKETEHDQYKTSKNSNLSIEKLECNNSNDIERQYNTYNRRFKDRIYTKKMFSNKIDILNKEIGKLKRLNKIPKDYPLFEIK